MDYPLHDGPLASTVQIWRISLANPPARAKLPEWAVLWLLALGNRSELEGSNIRFSAVSGPVFEQPAIHF